MADVIINKWIDFIDMESIKSISNEIGVSNELVRLWARNGHLPYGDNLKKFVALANKKLSPENFEIFLNSLAQDVLGTTLLRSEAVNE